MLLRCRYATYATISLIALFIDLTLSLIHTSIIVADYAFFMLVAGFSSLAGLRQRHRHATRL